MNGKYLEPKCIYLKDSNFDEDEEEKLTKEGYQTLMAYMLPQKSVDRFTTLAQVLKAMTDQTNIGEKFEICSDLDFEIKQLLASLVYLTNSTSFAEGDKYHEFDKKEIDRKLRRRRKE